MKIVIDTNNLISGVLWSGPSARIMELARIKKISIGTSNALFSEFCTVLTYPRIKKWLLRKRETAENAETVARRLVTFLDRTSGLPTVCADALDNEILACAVDFGADAIISGDDHILDVGDAYQNIPIMRASVFLAKYFPEKQ